MLRRAGLALLRPVIEVVDSAGHALGTLRQRLWAAGGPFEVLDPGGRRIARLRLAEGAAVLAAEDGRAIARLVPAEGAERRMDIDETLSKDERALCVAALAGLDRII